MLRSHNAPEAQLESRAQALQKGSHREKPVGSEEQSPLLTAARASPCSAQMNQHSHKIYIYI